ncbi:MAG: GntR family transcriptional regulator [Deltaproteobacteria bacterium]|nr:GntR family transcriptional regulator [Deltaproteobacteria bacterium]
MDANSWIKVYEILKEKIIKGIYNPGEKLNEREIAQLAYVSRTPVREALRILENEGYVINIPKKGVFVKKYSPSELDTLHRMLMRLEGLAMEMASIILTPEDINALEEMNREMEVLSKQENYTDYFICNINFHLYFPKVTGSSELFDTISQLRKRIFRFYYAQITMYHDPGQYVKDHWEIIAALKGEGDKRPEKLMEEHIDRARRSFLEFYRKFSVQN